MSAKTESAGADMLLDILAEEVGATQEAGAVATYPQAVPEAAPANTGTKVCTKCEEELPVDNFGRHATTKDRRQPWCKACQRAYDQVRYKQRKAAMESAPLADKQAKESKQKQCVKCSQTKPVEEFPINVRSGDGRHSWCKVCMREYTRDRRTKKDTDWEIGVALPEPVSKTTPKPPGKKNPQPIGSQAFLGKSGMSKKCGTCGVVQPASSFYKDKTTADGLYRLCKACTKAGNRRRYLSKKEGKGPKITVDFATCMGLLNTLRKVSEDEYRDLNSQILFACKSYLNSRESHIQ